jgi:hypothetical protein
MEGGKKRIADAAQNFFRGEEADCGRQRHT